MFQFAPLATVYSGQRRSRRLLPLLLTLALVAQLFVFAGAASAAPGDVQTATIHVGAQSSADNPAQSSQAITTVLANNFATAIATVNGWIQSIHAYTPTISNAATTAYQCILEEGGNVK